MPERARVVIYCRISSDREGIRGGVRRQARLCHELVEREGLDLIHEVLEDNDRSAMTDVRPSWDRVLELARAGEIDGVVAWHPDRLYRRTKDLVTLIETVEEHGLQIWTCESGRVDLSSSSGRLQARLLGAVAEHESELKSERIKAQKAQAAKEGLPNGGPRPFGYEKDGIAVRPREAVVFVAAVESFIADDRHSLWAAAQLATEALGEPMSVRRLRALFRNPRYAGIRVHRPAEILAKVSDKNDYDIEGALRVEAKWPALITEAQHKQLCTILSNPRRTSFDRTRPRTRSLLGGLVTCARPGCGGAMGYCTTTYKCSRLNGCGGGAITSRGLERHIIQTVFHRLNDPELRATAALPPEVVAEHQRLVAELDRLQRERDALPGLFAGRGVSVAAITEALDDLDTQASTIQAELDQVAMPSLAALSPEMTAEAFLASSTTQQRQVIAHFVREIIVYPVTANTAPRFNPARVDIWWRGAPERPAPRTADTPAPRRTAARRSRRPRPGRQ